MIRRGSEKRRWRGIAAAPGIALGPAFVYRVSRAEPQRRVLADDKQVAEELHRLDESLKASYMECINGGKEEKKEVMVPCWQM